MRKTHVPASAWLRAFFLLSGFFIGTPFGTAESLPVYSTGKPEIQSATDKRKGRIPTGSTRQGNLSRANSQKSRSFDEPIFPNWTFRTRAKGPRAEGQSVVYNKKIYVFNGLTPTLKINNTNEVYDPATNQWTLLTSMPNDPQGKPYAVTHNGIALVDNTVWIVGGRVGNNPGPATDNVWIYTITTDSWALGPKLPAPRAGGGLARVGRRLHLFGGFGSLICNDDKGDHFVYDLDNPAAGWQSGLAPLPNPRNHFGTVAVGGKIYAIGGQYGHDCGGGQDQKFVHMYDPVTDTWTRKKDLLYANSHVEPGTFALDGKIMVTGGERQGQNILQYDPATDTWIRFDQMPTALIATSAKVIDTYYIVSHGGAPGSQQSQDTTRVKSITRTRSDVLSFWPSQLSASAPQGGRVDLKPLLGTFTDKANYTINTATLPAWLTVSTSSASTDEWGMPVPITLNATGLLPGTYEYDLTATAPGYSQATTHIVFTVEQQVNLAPVVSNPGGQTSRQGEGVALQIQATDANILRYTATGLPPGLTISETTGLISGTVAASAATGSPYAVQVTVKDNGTPVESTSVAFIWTILSTPTQVLTRINAGGSAVTTNGIAWSASQYFTGGKSYTNAKVTSIAGTDNDAIYLTEYSATTNLGAFSFAMPVQTSGLYTVKLHFAEIYWGATGGRAGGSGQRLFNVNLEGGPAELVNYDIVAEVGTMTASVKTFDVMVADGILNIDFTASVNQPKVSAIEVLGPPAAVNHPPVLTSIGTQTVAEGQQLTVALTATDPDGEAVTISATNLPPFASLINNTLTFTPDQQAAGSYPITIVATDSRQATDQKTFTLVVNEVTASFAAIGLTLINADTDQDIRVLVNNDVLDVASLPTTNLNIRATTNPATVGSVKFEMSGAQVYSRTETDAPYALFGDNKANYYPWQPKMGTYTLKATPYSKANGGGTTGDVFAITFTVANTATARMATQPRMVSRNGWRVYPNPTAGVVKLEFDADHSLPLRIQVTNVLGQSVLHVQKQDLKFEELDLNGYPQGIYFITVESKMGISTHTLVRY